MISEVYEVTGKITPVKTLKAKINIPVIQTEPITTEITITPTNEVQTFTPEEGTYFNKATCEAINIQSSTLSITPDFQEQTFTPPENEFYNKVICQPINLSLTEVTVTSTGQTQIIEPSQNQFFNKVIVNPIQETASPSFVSFSNYEGYGDLDISWLRTNNMTSFANMFNNVVNMNPPDLQYFDTTNVTDMHRMFMNSGGTNWRSLDFSVLENFDTSNVTNFERMFNTFGYGNSTTQGVINLTGLDFSSATNVDRMLNGVKAKYIILAQDMDLSNITSLSYFLNSLPYTVSIDHVGEMIVDNVRNFSYMFSNSSKLETFEISGWNMDSLTSNGLLNMFQNCPKLDDMTLKDILMAMQWIPEGYNVKTLAHLGLSSAQATKCVDFPEWTELEALGWTTGY